MSQMRRFFWVAAIIAALAITSAAQQQVGGNNKKSLAHGEKCTDVGGCMCVNVDVKVNCSCQITLGSGTQHCPVGDAGGPKPLQGGLLIFVGGLIGSGLTYVVMRRRVTRS